VIVLLLPGAHKYGIIRFFVIKNLTKRSIENKNREKEIINLKRRWKIIAAIKIIAVMLFSYQLLICPVEAGNSKVGTTGAQFLKIGVGGRPIGMGSAYAGIADDVNALYWNPGGIGQIKGTELMAMHNSWLQSINHEYVGFAQEMSPMLKGTKGTIGIGITYLTVQDIEKRAGDTEVADSTFGATDMAVGLAYGLEVSPGIFTGLELKFINQKIDDKSANGIAGDLGMLYKVNEKIGVGLAVQNLGSKIKFINTGDPLPMNIKAGIGYKPIEGLTIGLDVNVPNDNNVNVAAGAEFNWKLTNNFSIVPRAGYKTGTDLGSMSGLGAGIGFKLNGLGFDFAYVPAGDLGNTYRVSFLAKL
jgi:hypothetical protein